MWRRGRDSGGWVLLDRASETRSTDDGTAPPNGSRLSCGASAGRLKRPRAAVSAGWRTNVSVLQGQAPSASSACSAPSALVVAPPVVQTFEKLVVVHGVTVLVVCAVPEQNLRVPVGVVVTGVDEFKLAAEVERIVAHQEPMGRPLGTCGKLASIDWLLQAQSKKAVPDCVLVALVEHEI